VDDESAYRLGLKEALDGGTVSMTALLLCAEKYEAAAAYSHGWRTGQELLCDYDVSVLEGETVEHE